MVLSRFVRRNCIKFQSIKQIGILTFFTFLFLFTCYTFNAQISTKKFHKNWIDTKIHKPSINTVYRYQYELLNNLEHTCYEKTGIPSEICIVYLIKSGLYNYEKREVIRKTWGNDTRLDEYKIKKVFMLGVNLTDSKAMEKTLEESATFGDMLIGEFEDTYYNLSIKAMMGVNWCREFCPHAKFYVMMDDNSYISTRNLLKLLNDKKRFLPSQEFSFLYMDANDSALTTASLDNSYRLYGGILFAGTSPIRYAHKWYVSESEYPYATYPAYINGIAFLANFAAFQAFYEASLVTRDCKFDDAYFGYLSLKAGITPIHIPGFSLATMNFSNIQDFETIIASHPYSVNDALKAWEIENNMK